jgi:hypothetical protein
MELRLRKAEMKREEIRKDTSIKYLFCIFFLLFLITLISRVAERNLKHTAFSKRYEYEKILIVSLPLPLLSFIY